MNHLEAARRAAGNANVIGRPNDPAQEMQFANMHAAVAQAEALTRIAECLEVLVEERTATIALAQAESIMAKQEHEIEQLSIINRELGEDIQNLEAERDEARANARDYRVLWQGSEG